MVSVHEHQMVPEHSIVEGDGLDDVLDEYDITKTDLPKITLSDPALPEDATVGDVIEIRRDSRTAEEAIVYRLVVE